MARPIIVEQSRAIPVVPAEAFAKTLPMALPTLFRRWYGPIPPIKAVRDQQSLDERAASKMGDDLSYIRGYLEGSRPLPSRSPLRKDIP